MSLLVLTMVHDFSKESQQIYQSGHDNQNTVDVILDNIRNIEKFNPDYRVVMHVNKTWNAFDPRWITDYFSNVHVAPKRYAFEHGHSQIAIILKSFQHAIDLDLDFEYVCITHSGELFVKPGALDYMRQHEFGIWENVQGEWRVRAMNDWRPYINAEKTLRMGEDIFNELFDPYCFENYKASHLEGTFYSKELFLKVYSWFDENYHIDGLGELGSYMEELMIPTVAYHLSDSKQPAQPIGAFYIEEGHKTLDSKKYVESVIANEPVMSWSQDSLPYWVARLGEQILDTTNTFTVKRFNRVYDDPVRTFVREL